MSDLAFSKSRESRAIPREAKTLAAHERDYIDYVLVQCGGNVSLAARWLGLHRQSLQRKLRKSRGAERVLDPLDP